MLLEPHGEVAAEDTFACECAGRRHGPADIYADFERLDKGLSMAEAARRKLDLIVCSKSTKI